MEERNDTVLHVIGNNRRPTILFSTSRMWNPGDDFILFGIRNLLAKSLGPINPIVYNRNPELHQLRILFDRPTTIRVKSKFVPINIYKVAKPVLSHKDNSWHEDLGTDAINLAIFAGTPEWLGEMVSPLREVLLQTNTPVVYLGLGIYEATKKASFLQLSLRDRELLEKARLITVRDEACAELLGPVNPHYLPCPALFSALHAKRRFSSSRIALSTQGVFERNGQRISKDVFDFSIELFKKLINHYRCSIVCHYMDELKELRPHFNSNVEFIYSYDSHDYIQIYDEFDLTVNTRIHGAGLCASLGIPGFVIAHSARSDTAKGFCANLLAPGAGVDEAFNRIRAFDIETASVHLIEHKRTTEATYLNLLNPILKNIFQ